MPIATCIDNDAGTTRKRQVFRSGGFEFYTFLNFVEAQFTFLQKDSLEFSFLTCKMKRINSDFSNIKSKILLCHHGMLKKYSNLNYMLQTSTTSITKNTLVCEVGRFSGLQMNGALSATVGAPSDDSVGNWMWNMSSVNRSCDIINQQQQRLE